VAARCGRRSAGALTMKSFCGIEAGEPRDRWHGEGQARTAHVKAAQTALALRRAAPRNSTRAIERRHAERRHASAAASETAHTGAVGENGEHFASIEVCDLRRDQVDFTGAAMHVRRSRTAPRAPTRSRATSCGRCGGFNATARRHPCSVTGLDPSTASSRRNSRLNLRRLT
jgi:hypothetical protein